MFATTYVCEKLFSTMKIVKIKFRSRLTDKYLRDQLRLILGHKNLSVFEECPYLGNVCLNPGTFDVVTSITIDYQEFTSYGRFSVYWYLAVIGYDSTCKYNNPHKKICGSECKVIQNIGILMECVVAKYCDLVQDNYLSPSVVILRKCKSRTIMNGKGIRHRSLRRYQLLGIIDNKQKISPKWTNYYLSHVSASIMNTNFPTFDMVVKIYSGKYRQVSVIQSHNENCEFCTFVCPPNVRKIRSSVVHCTKKRSGKIILQHDNAQSHTARVTMKQIRTSGWETLPHSPYSPDLAPFDYHLIGSVKKQLRGQRSETLENIWKAQFLAYLDRSRVIVVERLDHFLHRFEVMCVIITKRSALTLRGNFAPFRRRPTSCSLDRSVGSQFYKTSQQYIASENCTGTCVCETVACVLSNRLENEV
ncbi:hypothetical protein ANN_17218 [Periplaneta americana]|uniref:Uncharacterized protein n=1 Tax=Periplaneta americana TaxID=6978 RepID=A0ABQ8SSB4_PERAM|nr:hypothetical protein ANN_17218 [Periplaneta americana]